MDKLDLPRVTIMNDGGSFYRSYCASERPTADDLDVMVDLFARSGVDTCAHCVHARWQAYYDSRVVEIAGDLSPKAVEPWHYAHYWAWLTIMRRLIERGDDPPRVLAESCHRRRMTFLALFRLNDVHGLYPHEGRYGSFRRDHPEWVFAEKSMDYAVPQVRQHVLSVVQELVDRYDIDGIDFDFMRAPHYFRDGQIEANTPVMTAFVDQVRAILDKAGEKKDRRLLFCARVPMSIDECEQVGLDVRHWIGRGRIDMVCPMGYYYMPWTTLISHMPDWSGLTGSTNCGLYPTLGPFVEGYGTPYIDGDSLRGAVHSYYTHGADGVALYNTWNLDLDPDPYDIWGAVRDMGRPDVLASKPRRYHCYLGAPLLIHKGERKTIDIHLPEDPGAAGDAAALRFFGCNLTQDHHIDVDLNGVKVDGRSLRLDRNQTGGYKGTPNVPYGNQVTFSMAATAAKQGTNQLGVTLVESAPDFQQLPEYLGVPASEGGIAVAMVEALFGYRELPNPTRPGALPRRCSS